MKILLAFAALILLAFPTIASNFNYVLVPVPDNTRILSDLGFQLFHRNGDFWIGSLPADVEIPVGGTILCEFDRSKGDLYLLKLASADEADKLSGNVEILYSKEREFIIRATYEELRSLPPLKAQWIHINPTPKPMGYSGVALPQTDEFHPLVPEMVAQVSQIQYEDNLQTLQDFVTRNTFTAQCDSAGLWIEEQLQSFGLETELHSFTIGGTVQFNVVGELTGETYPDSIVFITAHYDATAGEQWEPEPAAPGADDNGSGTACFLECARVLSQYSFERTIRFVGFSGEEQGLWGSNAYVDDLVAANADVMGCFNFDMIAYSGSDPLPPDLMLYVDNNPLSQAMAEKVEEAALIFCYDEIEPVVVVDPGSTGSDHAPFWNAGWAAIEGIEAQPWGPEFNPWYHSVNDVVANCDIEYAFGCTRSAIAALAEYAGPIIESGPALAVGDFDFEEVTGNGNGNPDSGETLNLIVTLVNVGVDPATGIYAELTTSDPYLSITQGISAYPDLNPEASGIGNTPFTIEIDDTCPMGTTVFTQLEITANGGYSTTASIFFTVSDPLYEPSGPDIYGYYAFDMNDGILAPDYEWTEIAPVAGGNGDVLTISTNQTVPVDLSFDFQYYGADFDAVSISSSGWMSFGETTTIFPVNLSIPHTVEPNYMVAPFWDEFILDTQSQICTYYNTLENTFIIEWYNLRHSLGDLRETFQAVLFDPEHHLTVSGDGEIVIYYYAVDEPSWCSVGLENGSGTIGLQYVYNNNYITYGSPLESGFALKFTTEHYLYPNAPLPFSLLMPVSGDTVFSNEITFAWEATTDPDPGQEPTYNVWIDTLETMETKWEIATGLSDTTLTYSELDENKLYYWNVHADDINSPGTWATVFTFYYAPSQFVDNSPGSNLPKEFALRRNYPNPFNPVTTISYDLPKDVNVSLLVYDVMGREVATLVDEYKSAGTYNITFDAKNLVSGVYFVRLTVDGGQSMVQKVVLMK